MLLEHFQSSLGYISVGWVLCPSMINQASYSSFALGDGSRRILHCSNVNYVVQETAKLRPHLLTETKIRKHPQIFHKINKMRITLPAPPSPRQVSEDCEWKLPSFLESVDDMADQEKEVSKRMRATKKRPWVSAIACCYNEDVASKPSKKKRRIHFDRIEIIELPIILGDHPCVQDGPPLSVGWDPQLRFSVSLDRFEQARQQHRRRFPVRISEPIRRALLTKHGFRQCDMDQATIEAKKIKFERFFSLTSLMLDETTEEIANEEVVME